MTRLVEKNIVRIFSNRRKKTARFLYAQKKITSFFNRLPYVEIVKTMSFCLSLCNIQLKLFYI